MLMEIQFDTMANDFDILNTKVASLEVVRSRVRSNTTASMSDPNALRYSKSSISRGTTASRA